MMNQLISRALANVSAKLITIIIMTTMLAWITQPSFAAAKKHTTKSMKTTKTAKTAKLTKTNKAAKTIKAAKSHKTFKSAQSTKKTKTGNQRTAHKIKHTQTKKKKTLTTKHANKQNSKPAHKKIAAQKKHSARVNQVAHASSQAVNSHAMVNTTNISQSHLPTYSLSSIENNLVSFVRKTVESIRYTAYKLGGTKFNTSEGIYVVDCSTYVDHIIKSVYPRAYTSLTSWSGTAKPTTDDYYQYFTNLSDKSRHWNMIDDVEQLRPGDVLVFRSKNRYGIETGGHVMVVMDKPAQEGNTFLVRVADSASSGHSKDTRMPHASGIGIGTMLLKVNPKTFQPYAYAWKVGSRWESNVNFAMARPVGLS